jgi:hypothetical protein
MFFTVHSQSYQLIHCYLKGQCLCQCQDDCPNIWAPDEEEQRYCWGCSQWFNTTCLSKARCSQASVATKQNGLQKYHNHAKIIVEVAFQPTARGGTRHFASGNGRIVRLARGFLDNPNLESHAVYIAHRIEKEADGEFNEEDAWAEIMEEQIGMKRGNRGNAEYEQLIVRDQQMFSCSVCTDMVL